MDSSLTPGKIVEELDKYIIGQAEAKKAVAIALRNRWRRLQAPPEMRQEIMPNNILMIGATGVGKTEIARRLAQLTQAPFVKVEASKFTEVGYVGRDVESMVRDLVEQSVNMVKTAHKMKNQEKAAEIADEMILDLLVPPLKGTSRRNHPTNSEETENDTENEKVSGSELELYERTREKFRIKLKKGELDDRKVEIEVTVPTASVQVMGPMGMEGMESLQDMLANMVPKKKKLRTVTIKEAREIYLEEETQRLIDMEAVTKDALDRAQNAGIIFIDEIDKITSRGGKERGGPDVSREGVQRDLLPVVEGTTVNTKYGSVKTDHMLFIAAGAFHVARPSDLIPELQGRFPIRVELSSLTKEDFIKILSQPRNALTRQYQALLQSESIELSFEPAALEAIAEIAFNVNQEVENIGARRLHTILSNLLDEILFKVPDQTDEKQFVITAAFVNEKLSKIIQKKELTQFIL
jgi:ATP-dependent HslUV protease ATP-binding subunit HslU